MPWPGTTRCAGCSARSAARRPAGCGWRRSPGARARPRAAPTSLDPGELFELTGGNPFYVSEVLANPSDVVPLTVVDAVLARVRTLSQEAQTALDRLAVLPAGGGGGAPPGPGRGPGA